MAVNELSYRTEPNLEPGEELWTQDKFVLIVSVARKTRTVRPDPAMLAGTLLEALPKEYFDIDIDDWSVTNIEPAF